jgi:hypothetical protein
MEWFSSLGGGINIGVGVNGMRFENEKSPPTISGWGVALGVGKGGGGVAAARAHYWRAPDWMIPPYLRGIVVPPI